MLGRIPSGATFAALPLAALLTALAQGWDDDRYWLWIVIGATCLLVGTLVWMFAPWIPGARNALPAQRKVRQLEKFWVEGHQITRDEVESLEESEALDQRRKEWHNRAGDWIEAQISPIEAERFRHPEMENRRYKTSYDERHNFAVRLVFGCLPHLIRLRDEQQRKLR